MTEDEMIGWYHLLNGKEFEQTPGDSEGQGSLLCYGPWGCRVRHDRVTDTFAFDFPVSGLILRGAEAQFSGGFPALACPPLIPGCSPQTWGSASIPSSSLLVCMLSCSVPSDSL